MDGFNPVSVGQYDADRIALLLQNKGLVRNRRKIEATVTNARTFLEVQAMCGTFDRYLWQFVDGRPRQNHWRSAMEVPAATPVSEAMSRDLRQRGFKFVGPVICYSLMMAVGMVNDHTLDCFRYEMIRQLSH